MKKTNKLITFYPYQQAYLKDKSKFKIAMFARQTGKTFTSCAEIVQDCLLAEKDGMAVEWVILSRGERQSKVAMDSSIKPLTKAFYSIYKNLKEPEYLEYSHKGEEATYNALEVKFPSGSVITALPANPDTARGFSRNVLLDEFAFHKDSRAIWQAVFPIISKPNLKLRVISTPNGKANKFYELWHDKAQNNKNSIWQKYSADIFEAVKQGLPRDIQELKQALNDEDAWRQEFCLEFMDEATAWFTYDLINEAENPNAGIPENYQSGNCYIGVDVARRGDLWVAVVLERVGDVLWMREMVELKNQTFLTQEEEMAKLIKKYKVVKIAIDQTGMGEKVVEDAKRRFGSSRVHGILFNNATKQDLATVSKQYFEDKQIRVPNHAGLRTDLHNIKKETSATGLPKFVANRENGSHSDRAWALMLAINAGSSIYQEYKYMPVVSSSFKKGII